MNYATIVDRIPRVYSSDPVKRASEKADEAFVDAAMTLDPAPDPTPAESARH